MQDLNLADQVQNFKMARRCTIPIPHANPSLLESYADYFIAGKYEEAPFQVDIFDRSKACIMHIDVAREVKKAMQRHAILNGAIESLDHVIVPRLRWSDRYPETFELRRKIVTSMDNKDGA